VSRLAKGVERHHGWLALTIYLALALVWDRLSLAHLGSVCPCGLPGDPAQYTWAFVWFPHALFHGLSLLHTRAMWAPEGINLAGATAVPFLALIAAPVTYIWGPIVAYNLITILAPVTAAGAAYLLCRHLTRSHWAALIAGAFFGFGTYEIAQLEGHLHLSVIFCVPLAALTVIQFLDGSISRRRFGIQLCVILLVQFLISLEVFFTLTVLGAVGLVLAWAFAECGLRARLRAALVPLVAAYVVTLALMSWYIVALASATAYAKGTGQRLPTDLLSMITPMPYTWLGGTHFASVSARFIAGKGEDDLFVGLPMMLVLVGYLAACSRRRLARWLIAFTLLTLLWILGTRLWVDGHSTIWLPYALLARLPGFDQVLQGRVAVYFALICAVVLALWLADGGRATAGMPEVTGAPPSRWRATSRWLWGLLVVACVLPNIISPTTDSIGTWDNPTFFSQGLYKHYLRKGENVLPIRWGFLSESPMWQAETHMYFNLASGYFTTALPQGWVGPLTRDLWFDTPYVARDAPRVRGLVRSKHVSDILVEDDELQAWSPVLTAAGLHPGPDVGGVTLFHVPAAWLAGDGSG
jgi:hypothetical protein